MKKIYVIDQDGQQGIVTDELIKFYAKIDVDVWRKS
jgi:hypothetical protein